MTFSGEFFFPSKVPEFLHVLFNLVVKHSPVFFWAGLHFISEKNKTDPSDVSDNSVGPRCEVEFPIKTKHLRLISFQYMAFCFVFPG